MRSSWLPLILLVAGCGDTMAPISPTAPGPVPAAARTASRTSGAFIVRWEGNDPEVGIFIYDADQQLLAGLATDNSNFGCVPGTELGDSHSQLVVTPAGSTTYLARVDQVYLTIYRWDGSGGISCTLLTGPHLAFGIVPGLLQSNDIFGTSQHAGTLGMGVRGAVTLADGSVQQASAHFLDLTSPAGEVRSVFARVRLGE